MTAAPQQKQPGTGLAPQAEVLPVVPETTAVAVAAQAKAAIEARYLMAIQKPRNWEAVRDGLLKSCARPRFAEMARYRKPMGQGKSVEGPSIRFAEAVIREMGNVMAEAVVVYNDDEMRIIRVVVTDLESNLTFPTDVTIEKAVERRAPRDGDRVLGVRTNSTGQRVYRVQATEDALLNKQNALISKAMRTGIGRIFPEDLLEEAMEAVRATLERTAKEGTNLDRLIKAFGKVGVTRQYLETYLRHPVDAMTADEYQELQAIGQAIKDGETTWDAVVNRAPEPAAREQRGVRVDAYADRKPVEAEVMEARPVAVKPLPPDPYAEDREETWPDGEEQG